MVLDRVQFGEVQRQLPRLAEMDEADVVEFADGDGDLLKAIIGAEREMVDRQRASDDLLDGVVAEDLCEQNLADRIGETRRARIVAAHRADGGQRNAEIVSGRDHALGDRVHHAGPQKDGGEGVEFLAAVFGRRKRIERADATGFDESVHQEFARESLGIFLRDCTLDQKSA